jgi:hypothetical protein
MLSILKAFPPRYPLVMAHRVCLPLSVTGETIEQSASSTSRCDTRQTLGSH